MKKKERTSKPYYISGIILICIALIIFLFLIVFSFLNPIEDISKSYYLFIILGLGIIIFVVAYILLKKANKLRLDEETEKTKEMVRMLNEKEFISKKMKEENKNDTNE